MIGPQLVSMPGRIEEALAARDMLQKELAAAVGVAPPTISRSGAAGMTVWLAAAMSKVLRVRLPWLLLGEGPRDDGSPPVAPDYFELREAVGDEQKR